MLEVVRLQLQLELKNNPEWQDQPYSAAIFLSSQKK
jgi:hypothetical protein